jgi:nitric oxide synthase oxygenase domain/subunit
VADKPARGWPPAGLIVMTPYYPFSVRLIMEFTIRKLIDDKRYYQLELVNRETNFNKVFNSNLNVGVMNPLVKVSLEVNNRLRRVFHFHPPI